MKTDHLTLAQATELCGANIVDQLLSKNCDFTGRTIDGLVEFGASVPHGPGQLSAFYYQTQDAINSVYELDQLKWEVSHFSYLDY